MEKVFLVTDENMVKLKVINKVTNILKSRGIEAKVYSERHLVEATVKYPVSFNGKVRFTLDLPADTSVEEVEKSTLGQYRAGTYLAAQRRHGVPMVYPE